MKISMVSVEIFVRCQHVKKNVAIRKLFSEKFYEKIDHSEDEIQFGNWRTILEQKLFFRCHLHRTTSFWRNILYSSSYNRVIEYFWAKGSRISIWDSIPSHSKNDKHIHRLIKNNKHTRQRNRNVKASVEFCTNLILYVFYRNEVQESCFHFGCTRSWLCVV